AQRAAAERDHAAARARSGLDRSALSHPRVAGFAGGARLRQGRAAQVRHAARGEPRAGAPQAVRMGDRAAHQRHRPPVNPAGESLLQFGFGRRLPVILQTEAAECGLACLAMVAGFHGLRTDLSTMRRRFSVSLKGATLKNLIEIAKALQLASRPLKLDLEHLKALKLPCVLHWDMNHFVVLESL